MSNPAIAPKESTSRQLELSRAPDAFLDPGYAAASRAYKRLDRLSAALGALDVQPRNTFYVPRDLTVDAGILSRRGPTMAVASAGLPVPRVRTSHGKAVVGAAWDNWHDGALGTQCQLGAALQDKVYVTGGAECTIGRLVAAYPRLNNPPPPRPIVGREAREAMVRCGLYGGALPSAALRPYPLLSGDITVNPKASNGYPVLGKWETDGAADLCMRLAVGIRGELEQQGARAWKRWAEDTKPHLVTLQGKCKADYYGRSKVVEARLRFYNVFPRQVVLNLQVATQPFDANARSLLVEGHSFSGVTLVRGGAGELVGALDEQLERSGWAYVHMGDDSWIVRADGVSVTMFALDCSNFDLTQHSRTTQAVHEAFREELRRYDGVAADLWYEYARERQVVVSGSACVRMAHAGPSGMPLQSKVNDVLMDVMINRLIEALGDRPFDEHELQAVLEDVSLGLGFSVRLEQYWRGVASSLYEALEEQPFLFVGYYFGVRGGQVVPMADLVRSLAQMPYPTSGWVTAKQELRVVEAIRLGSIVLNWGLPLRGYDAVFAAVQDRVERLLDEALTFVGDKDTAPYRWAVQETPWGSQLEPSLGGIRRALGARKALWSGVELPSVSTLVPVSASWADMVEIEEEQQANAVGGTARRPLPIARVAPLRVQPAVVPTHPPTLRNLGRPPPTAVWGPNKQPRAVAGGRRVRGVQRVVSSSDSDVRSDSSWYDDEW